MQPSIQPTLPGTFVTIDVADVDAQEVIPGGQSGVFYNPNYSSQLPLWLTNSYHNMALSDDEAIDVAVKMTTFGPVSGQVASDEENYND